MIISVETARRQARRLGAFRWREELDLLVVPRVLLHLVGYDDHEPREARLMHAREHEILLGRLVLERPALWTGLLDA